MSKRVAVTFGLIISLALISPALAGNSKGNSSEQGGWKPNVNKNYVVTNDADQQRYENDHQAIPGIIPLGSRVYENVQVHREALRSGSSGSNNLSDHGGSILTNLNVKVIYVGVWPLNAASNDNFWNGLAGTVSTETLTTNVNQYSRKTGVSIKYSGAVQDVSGTTPWTSSPTSSQIGLVIQNNFSNPDPNTLYLIYSSNYPSNVSYCGFHGAASINGKAIAFAYIPNTSGITGCSVSNYSNWSTTTSNYSTDLNSIENVASHELYEAMTDSIQSGYAWYDTRGNEIGDKCAWITAGALRISTASIPTNTWFVQSEWGNSKTACVLP